MMGGGPKDLFMSESSGFRFSKVNANSLGVGKWYISSTNQRFIPMIQNKSVTFQSLSYHHYNKCLLNA